MTTRGHYTKVIMALQSPVIVGVIMEKRLTISLDNYIK